MKLKKNTYCDETFGCCLSKIGVVHILCGVGLGFLLVEYLALGNLALWGWLLVGVGVLGHIWKR